MKRHFTLFFLFITYFTLQAFFGYAQNTQLDSLEKLLSKTTIDTLKIDLLLDIGRKYIFVQPDKTVEYGNQALELARKIQDEKRISLSINRIGGGYWGKGDLVNALKYFVQSKDLAQKQHDQHLYARTVSNIGAIYMSTHNYLMALSFYMLGNQTFEKIGDYDRLMVGLDRIGEIYKLLEKYDSAEFYLNKAINLPHKERSDIFPDIYNNLGHIRLKQRKYAESRQFLEKAHQLNQELNKTNSEALILINLAELDLLENKVVQAAETMQKAVKIAEKTQIKETMTEAYNMYSKVLFAQKKLAEAYHYQHLFIIYNDSIRSKSAENALQIFEYERKQGEIALLRKEKQLQQEENNRKNLMVSFLILVVLLMFILGFLQIRNSRQIRKTLKIVEDANEEINQQKEQIFNTLETVSQQKQLIENQHTDIIASINYAKRIQNAVLPLESKISEVFKDSFVLYKPKDIVAGDFYWFANHENFIFLAVGDCTGHGVSGAFMTLIGNTILNQIINENYIFEPSIILNELDKRLLQTLQQSSTNSHEVNDGMDIALIRWDKEKQKIRYSGAKRPLLYFKDNQLHEIKASRFPIGSLKIKEKKFEEHELDITPDLRLYMFTDGYADQFGGAKKSKFMTKHFKTLLQNIQSERFTNQKQILDENFKNWKNTESQTDDMLVVGLKF